MTAESDVLIVGAGIQGCACALNLARQGLRVRVLEKNVAGRHASGVNAGGVRMLMREVAEIPLSLRAMELWEHLDDLFGKEIAATMEFEGGAGQIGIAVDQSEMDWCVARADETRSHGYDFEDLIDAQELQRLVPSLGIPCLGGIMSRRDGHANPATSTRAFRVAAEAAGAIFHEGSRVIAAEPGAHGWHISTGHGLFAARIVLNCAGAWGGAFARLVGDDLPADYFAPSMMVTARLPKFIDPVVIGIDRALSFKQTAAGTVVIGGGILGDPDLDNDTSVTVVERLTESARIVSELFPILRTAPITRTWAGLEAITPDHMPLIGPSRNAAGIWHIYGFSGHGFQLAPAIGESVARSIMGDTIDPLLLPFSPDRFHHARGLVHG